MAGQRHFVAITGAQGVGKSTFCRALCASVQSRSQASVELLNELGAQVRSSGVPVGSDSNSDTIAAVFLAHLKRERTSTGNIVILDRCLIDALAYTRVLQINSPTYLSLFEEIFASNVRSLSLVVHLELSETFLEHGAKHETPALRTNIANTIPLIIEESSARYIRVDAAHEDSISKVTNAIMNL